MMFFEKKSSDITIEKVTDKKTASLYINKETAKAFESLRPEMLSELKKNNIPEEEHEEYLQNLYKEVQLKTIERYKEILSKNTEEIQSAQPSS